MSVRGYKDLIVWQKSIDLADTVYVLTETFPKSEIYGLSNQMRRSAVSISSNIAEGAARHGKQEFIQFIGIARGSLAELHTQAIIASRRKYIRADQFDTFEKSVNEIDNMLFGLTKSLREKAS
jgi:four helix bundle protein